MRKFTLKIKKKYMQFFHKKKIARTLDNLNNEFEDNLKEIKQIKWAPEFIKTFIIFVASILILYFVRQFAPGNFSGLKLEKYLDEKIIECLDTEEMESRVLYNGHYDILSEDNVILVYSEYKVSFENMADGRCLSIFEREKENLLHEIFGINPSYKLVFCGKCEEARDCLLYKGFENDDLDQDGKMEFMLYTQSRFATRISNELILINKDKNGWSIVSPDMLEIRKKLCDIIDKDVQFSGVNPYNLISEKDKNKVYISAEIFRFYNVLNNDEFYDVVGVNIGTYLLSNPFNSALNICYSFTCNNWASFDKDYIYVMQQYNHKKLFADPNWNFGEPVFLYDEMDFRNEYDSYWGIQMGTSIFYTTPDKEPE